MEFEVVVYIGEDVYCYVYELVVLVIFFDDVVICVFFVSFVFVYFVIGIVV